MQTKSNFTVTCPFCGRQLQGVSISDDGFDYDGHQRGGCDNYTNIEKCTCKLGQLVGTVDDIKPMCRNCCHLVKGCCTNEAEIAVVRKAAEKLNINVDKMPPIKNLDGACDYHSLNFETFKQLLK